MIWKVSDGTTVAFALHSGGSPTQDTQQDNQWQSQNSDQYLWNTTVVCHKGLLHQPIWFCCWMGVTLIWTFCFSDWRQSSGNWSHSQKLSPALPVRPIFHPIFVSRYYKERHFKVFCTLPGPISLQPTVQWLTSTILIGLVFVIFVSTHTRTVRKT